MKFQSKYEVISRAEKRDGFVDFMKIRRRDDVSLSKTMLLSRYPKSAVGASDDFIDQHVRKSLAFSDKGILPILDVIYEDHHISFITDEPEGESLETILARYPGEGDAKESHPFSLSEILKIGMAIADTMGFFAERSLSLRNITSSHIYFLKNKNSFRLTFSGVERIFLNDYSLDLFAKGHLAFLSPERIGYFSRNLANSSEIYTLGVILYEILYLHNPFHAGTKNDIFWNILNKIPDLKKNDVPQAFLNIISKLLRKNPKDRYLSFKGVSHDIRKCIDSLGSSSEIPAFTLGKKDPSRELNYDIPTIGRDDILSAMIKHLDETLLGKGTINAINSFSGDGKTRIAGEILRSAEKKEMSVYRAKFTSYEKSIPMNAINRIFIAFEETLSGVDAKLLENWKKRAFDELGQYGRLLFDRLPYLKKHFPQFPRLPKVDHETEVRKVRECIMKLLTILDSDEKGTAIFLDDLQWADDTSIELLHELAKESNQNGLKKTYVLCAYRTEEMPEDHHFSKMVLQNLPKRSNLAIKGLSKYHSDRLIEALLDEKGAEINKICDLSYSLTQGNPFLIYTYLNMIIEKKIYRLNDAGDYVFDAQIAKKDETHVKIGEIMEERLKYLEIPTLRVIKAMATAGNVIPRMAVYNFFSTEADEGDTSILQKNENINVDLALEELFQKHLVVASENSLHFIHDRIRDAAWNLSSPEERFLLHRKYASFLISRSGEIEGLESKIVFEIAFHLQRSRPWTDVTSARKILFHAGKRAASLFSYQKTKEYLDSASVFFPQSEPELKNAGLFAAWIDLKELYADALSMSHQLYEAIAIYETLVSMITDDNMRVAKICGKISKNYLWLFDYPRSLFWGKKGLEMVGGEWVLTTGRSILKLLVWMPVFLVMFAWSRVFKRKRKEMISEEKAFSLSFQIDLMVPSFFYKPITAVANMFKIAAKALSYPETPFIMMSNAYWGVVFALYGFDRLSVKLYEKALRYFELNYDPHAVAFLYFTRGNLFHYTRGNMEKAVSDIEHAVRICEEIGDTFWLFLSY
ncbi:MAG: AAA family ATPase, partial [Oligoflexales bacterium]|nr:AAA family ATPase [Oligoflexales bacterium]